MSFSHHLRTSLYSVGGSHATSKHWLYALLALIDLQANVLALLSFRYGNFATVVLLLHTTTLPMVMLLSIYILGRRYTTQHMLGCFAAFSGLVVIFSVAYHNEGETHFSDELKGDMMSLMAACLYAVTNVGQEWLVSRSQVNATHVYLSEVGCWATVLAGLQFLLLEMPAVRDILWRDPVISIAFGCYVLSIAVFYGASAYLIRTTDALGLNLSLVTSNIFIMVASHFIFKESFTVVYWVAGMLILSGIALYSIQAPKGPQMFDETEDEMDSDGPHGFIILP